MALDDVPNGDSHASLPHPLKRKRGPSHSSGVGGDVTNERPLAKQSREEAVKEEVEEAKLETRGGGELDLCFRLHASVIRLMWRQKRLGC